ncbi:MAG: homocysteine S-methyltransferase [Desulfopila sp.]
MNPIQHILEHYPLLVVDGALATELERHGCCLDDPLWSAKLLLDQPELIALVHDEYLAAGADCIITASYQATFAGFRQRGCSDREAARLLASSVTIAREARDRFWTEPANRHNRPKPLVAASVGPYGAFLADGSEYRGAYSIDEEQLIAFHRRRLQTLIAAGPDILACETIPCLREARALVRLIEEYPGHHCWMSFCCRDGLTISNGERIRDGARWLHDHPQVAAVGINCTPPAYVASLIGEIEKETDKPIIVYPNSGEHYDPISKCWHSDPADRSFTHLAHDWFLQGARLIGGCCRTTPDDIQAIASWRRPHLPGT